MTDEQKQIQDQFHSFLAQRNSKTNVTLQEAQKLINLYRVLNVFGPDFMEEYNAKLLNISDEVNAALSALVGGLEVRQYIEFLKAQNHVVESDEESGSKRGYLPDPTADIGGSAGGSVPTGDFVSRADFEAFVNNQNEKLKALMDQLKAEQSAVLSRLTTGSQKTTTSPASSTEYSEIIEERK
ncbi:MAG: hypothetical protein II942_03695 [Alphaproteobacteria bacterium]|nr:hypothetical protein [Alphaproteobacteria bacterium]